MCSCKWLCAYPDVVTNPLHARPSLLGTTPHPPSPHSTVLISVTVDLKMYFFFLLDSHYILESHLILHDNFCLSYVGLASCGLLSQFQPVTYIHITTFTGAAPKPASACVTVAVRPTKPKVISFWLLAGISFAAL